MRYDEMGNVTEIVGPEGSSTSFAYDLSGRLISETDAAGTETSYIYDKAGRLVELRINGSSTRYEYDQAGNITAVTDAEGRSISLSYDELGNLSCITYPDGSKDSYEYDALSRLTKYTPRKGEATAYSYSAMGDVLSVTTGEQTTGYEYDMTAVINPDGSRSEAEYDALGNITKAVDALGAATEYAYTVDGLPESISYANGAVVTAEYDLNGRGTAGLSPRRTRRA